MHNNIRMMFSVKKFLANYYTTVAPYDVSVHTVIVINWSLYSYPCMNACVIKITAL